MAASNARSYWKSNIRIVTSLLCVWFFISFICGILLVDELDNIRFGGFKLGFWIAQQGSIYVFVVLIILYIWLMDRLDERYDLDESNRKRGFHERRAQRAASSAQQSVASAGPEIGISDTVRNATQHNAQGGEQG